MRNKPGIIFALLVSLSACTTTEPAVKVEFREVRVEVPRPCPVVKPTPPAKLERPLPADPGRLIDLLLAKLTEYAGAGGYVERADAAIETCTRP